MSATYNLFEREIEQLNGIDEVWEWKLSEQDFQEIDHIFEEEIEVVSV